MFCYTVLYLFMLSFDEIKLGNCIIATCTERTDAHVNPQAAVTAAAEAVVV